MLEPNVRKLIEKQFGKDIRYPSDAEALSYDIQKKTNESLSVNTLKRLLGMVEDVNRPRLFTLDVVSRYVGFSNWDKLQEYLDGGNDLSGFDEISGISASDLSTGDRVTFEYAPNRKVTCENVSGNSFVVVESENSKLQVGDVIEVESFILHAPLVSLNVVRHGAALGPYTAGKATGLSSVKVTKK